MGPGEHDEGADDEDFVGEGVHDSAEACDGGPSAGEVAVEGVGACGEDEGERGKPEEGALWVGPAGPVWGSGPACELDEEDEGDEETQAGDGVGEPEPQAGGSFQRALDGVRLGQGKMVG